LTSYQRIDIRPPGWVRKKVNFRDSGKRARWKLRLRQQKLQKKKCITGQKRKKQKFFADGKKLDNINKERTERVGENIEGYNFR